MLSLSDVTCGHKMGLRARKDVTDDQITLVATFSDGQTVVGEEVILMVPNDAQGQLFADRLLPLCDAYAAYLDFGGSHQDLVPMIAAFRKLPTLQTGDGQYLGSAVEATREVYYQTAFGTIVHIVRDAGVELMTDTELHEHLQAMAADGDGDGDLVDETFSFLDAVNVAELEPQPEYRNDN